MMIRNPFLLVAALSSGCGTYQPTPPATDDLPATAFPCLRTLATGDVRADDGHQLFVSYGCEGGPVIADVIHENGALVPYEARADFQQRFFRAIDADVDGSAPSDVIALAGSEAWVFSQSQRI